MACYTDKVFNRTSKVLLISDIPDLIWDGAPGQERENELRPTTRQRPTTTRDFEPENERGAAGRPDGRRPMPLHVCGWRRREITLLFPQGGGKGGRLRLLLGTTTRGGGKG